MILSYNMSILLTLSRAQNHALGKSQKMLQVPNWPRKTGKNTSNCPNRPIEFLVPLKMKPMTEGALEDPHLFLEKGHHFPSCWNRTMPMKVNECPLHQSGSAHFLQSDPYISPVVTIHSWPPRGKARVASRPPTVSLRHLMRKTQQRGITRIATECISLAKTGNTSIMIIDDEVFIFGIKCLGDLPSKITNSDNKFFAHWSMLFEMFARKI